MKNLNLTKLDDLCQQLSVVMTAELNRVSCEIMENDTYKIVVVVDSSGLIECDLSNPVDYGTVCELLRTAINAINLSYKVRY